MLIASIIVMLFVVMNFDAGVRSHVIDLRFDFVVILWVWWFSSSRALNMHAYLIWRCHLFGSVVLTVYYFEVVRLLTSFVFESWPTHWFWGHFWYSNFSKVTRRLSDVTTLIFRIFDQLVNSNCILLLFIWGIVYFVNSCHILKSFSKRCINHGTAIVLNLVNLLIYRITTTMVL